MCVQWVLVCVFLRGGNRVKPGAKVIIASRTVDRWISKTYTELNMFIHLIVPLSTISIVIRHD